MIQTTGIDNDANIWCGILAAYYCVNWLLNAKPAIDGKRINSLKQTRAVTN